MSSLKRHLHLESVRSSKRLRTLLANATIAVRFFSVGGGEIIKIAELVDTSTQAIETIQEIVHPDIQSTFPTKDLPQDQVPKYTAPPVEGLETIDEYNRKRFERDFRKPIEQIAEELADRQKEEDEHRWGADEFAKRIEPIVGPLSLDNQLPQKVEQAERDQGQSEVVVITFYVSHGEDGHLLEPVPEEVIAALPGDPERRANILRSMEGECRYYKGPSDREMDLDRFHTSQRPMKLDELDREHPPYFLAHEDAVKLPLMHTVNDIKMAVERNNSKSPELEAQSIDYQLNTTSDLHRADLHESQALIPEFGPHDMRSTLHVPADTKIEYIESITAPQESKQDNRLGQQAFQGGNRQYLILSCDTSRCEITESVRLNKSIELDPRGPEYDQITYALC